MYIVFFSTSDVFKAEGKMIEAGITCKVVPTPVQDKAYCGVCIETSDHNLQEVLAEMEFEVVQ